MDSAPPDKTFPKLPDSPLKSYQKQPSMPLPPVKGNSYEIFKYANFSGAETKNVSETLK